ncbi:MAG: carboxylating nicotinate-nucleotide diphosphorylase [Candidatus Heimdallarchaeota archaeon]|nr:carboxylating nicotinate-nucleotide diphosphorylase [Candidatus Heimdallarchaeota archaeon]
MKNIPNIILEKKLLEYLEEDMPFGDVTGQFIPNTQVIAFLKAKESGIVCGLPYVKILMETLGISVKTLVEDGSRIEPGDILLEIQGNSVDIIVVERTVLNFLMRLSGIASQTRSLVERVKDAGLRIRIAGTRKTTPGFRFFEKYAIEMGGGDPHRWDLSDMVLIKENHIKTIGEDGLNDFLKNLHKRVSFSKKIEIEVENLSQLKKILPYNPDIIMLDDFSIEDIHKAVELIEKVNLKQKILLEVSGGITPENIQNYFIEGINILSLGFLTHSVKSLDFSLKINEILNTKG